MTLQKRQFPMGDAPAEKQAGMVGHLNTEYGNDVVRSKLRAIGGDDVDHLPGPVAARLTAGTHGRLNNMRSWYYPGQGTPGATSQGKLFHDPKPTAEHRWPRGYDPERQAEARAVTGREVSHTPTGHQTMPTSTPSEPKAWARDILARSSADLSTFINRGSDTGTPYGNHAFEITDEQNGPGYKGERDRAGYHQGTLVSVNRKRSGEHAGSILMHEMGHADSALRGLYNSIDFRDEPAARGAEEARADIFSHRHFVARKDGKESAVRNQDYPKTAYGQRSKADQNDFAVAYKAEHEKHGLPTPSERTAEKKSAEQRAQHEAAMTKGVPPGVLPGQGMLFRRHADFDAVHAERDYGQWPLRVDAPTPERKYGEAPLDTIQTGRGVPPEAWRGNGRGQYVSTTPKEARQKRDLYDPDEEVAQRARRWWSDRSS